MATIVNTPASTTDNSGSMGFLLGIVLLIAFIALLFFYGLPFLSRSFNSFGAPQVNIPGKIDVNVQTPGK